MTAPFFGAASERIATMTLGADSRSITVELLDSPAIRWTEVNYAWLSPLGDIIRIGTSKQPIGGRLAAYAKDINKRLQFDKGSTPAWEAEAWLQKLGQFGHLTAYVHLPDEVDTVAGPVRPYLDIERALIAKHRPLLNRSHR
ncbi:hypothetical protein LAC81_02060 [Ensifer adhaerens]|uniref:hypothetical protein n=1 Tax=Ensifer adhaerens TaxID=106592 RepID=UPI001CC0DD0F|nr:hypothetical protein [Ensifer adhaerens]MBZ7920571.1 hypothetical protein [Ensifer adhaerens]UAX93046.1 hypothetical protein LAC78_02055 [Ensifer adhaerens]UAY00682.1 hypothetical protein LAC80_02060 [Ensifer adhaerens]UAY08063.1 hypothetical protein LAC81_02060 [Ensifer adhaerens]